MRTEDRGAGSSHERGAILNPSPGPGLADRWAAGALLFTCLTVYMSLVPLEFRPLPWAEALAHMRSIPFLDLGMYSRADWVANGVVFVPIGLCWCAALSEGSRARPAGAALLVTLLAAACAVGLELTQVYFARRTVSLNDVYAEMIGGAVGAHAWLVLARPLGRLSRALGRSFVPAARAVLVLYGALYLALSLFPYDFVVSPGELAIRLAQHPVTVLPSACAGARCAVDLAVEVAAAAPLGMLVLLVPWAARPGHLTVFAIGAALGLALEAVQLLMVSGTVQAVSLVTRGLGLVLGRVVAERLAAAGWRGVSPLLRPAAGLLVPIYLVVLMLGNHWQLGPPLSWSAAHERLLATSWVPFYYFYEAPEVFAVQKLAYQSAMYAPLGVLFWAWCHDRPELLARRWIPVVLALALAAVMGLGRLLLYRDTGPDPTNLLIAALAAYAGLRVAHFFGRLAAEPAPPAPAPPRDASDGAVPRRLAAAAVALVALVLGAAYPLGAAGAVVLGLAAYGLLAHARPRLWLFVVPLAIPALDRATLTGPLLFDELDLVLLVSLAAWLWREPYPFPSRRDFGFGRYLLGAFLLSAAAGAWLARDVIPSEQWGSLAGLDGPQNVLRRLGSYWLPALLVPCLVRQLGHDPRAFRTLALGMTAGLAYAALGVAWERHLFPGLLDLASPYRAAGPLSSMATGGASLDVYLATTVPFAAAALATSRPAMRAADIAVLVLAAYAVVMTFTRTTYLAVGISVATMAVLGSLGRPAGHRLVPVALALLLVAVLAGTAVLPGSYMRARLADAGADAGRRLGELEHALALAGDSLWRGVGTGTFPWVNTASRPPEERPGRALLRAEGGGTYLRLLGGEAIYFDQEVAVVPGRTYRLRVRVRSAEPASARVFVCEKHLMNSGACVSTPVTGDGSGRWQRIEIPLAAGDVGAPAPLGLAPPVFLSLSPPPAGQILDISQVALLDPAGRDLVRNGRFEQNGRGWSFTQDDHLAWHLKNLWAFLLFEQGVIGAAAFALLTVYVSLRIARAIGDFASGAAGAATTGGGPVAVAGALVAIHVLALTDAVLDAPRVAALVLLVYGAGLGLSRPLRAGLPRPDPHRAPLGRVGDLGNGAAFGRTPSIRAERAGSRVSPV